MANFCKYYKEVKQVSYDSGQTWENLDVYRVGELYESDSPDCGGGTTQYKWVNVSGEYTCVGTTKYQKTKKQQSTDGGNTWTDVSPIEYGTGAVIEYNSSDCSQSYSGQYLTFVALENGTFKFSGTSGNSSIQYSLDNGSTWTTLASGANSPTVTSGNKIMWKGTLTPNSTSYDYGIGTFSSTNGFIVEGNAMSLLYGDNFVGKTSLSGKNYAFFGLFEDCTSLTSAENLELPATTLAEYCYHMMFYGCRSLTTVPSNLLQATTLVEQCYSYMFYGCTSLTTAPQLPATTLANYCYVFMFSYCRSLTTAPSLPATTLTNGCYMDMFRGCENITTAPELLATTLTEACYLSMFEECTSLTTAPQLLATTLLDYCYYRMFRNCTNMNYIKCLATNISAYYCTNGWVSGVSSSGTFVKNSSMSSWTSGVSGIPTNWSIQNA